MSVQTELDRIIGAVEAAHLKVAEKGGTTARPYLVGNLEGAIDTIPQGSTEDLDSEIATQKQLIADIQTALEGKAAGGGGVETCTVTFVSGGLLENYSCPVYNDGQIDLEFWSCDYATDSAGTHVIENVPKGTTMVITLFDGSSFECVNAELLENIVNRLDVYMYSFRINGDCTITELG